MVLGLKYSAASRGSSFRAVSLYTRFEKRRRLTWSYARRLYRRDYDPRVSALFGRSSKKKTQPVVEELEEVPDVVEEVPQIEEQQEQRTYESIPADAPFWQNALQPRNIGPIAFGSAIGGFALYVIYLILIKDRTEDIERIEYDLNTVMTQLQRLKELRMEPDMTDVDAIRVRSFLISLIIKQKRQDPVRVINSALSLLGERHLSSSEKKVLVGVDAKQVVEPPEMEDDSLPDLMGLKMVDAAISEAQMEISPAFGADASVLWWHKLAYICILQMKKSGALFMTPARHLGTDEFALVGFEDPEEAFHAGKMPIHQQLWGMLSAIRDEGTGPSRPLEEEKHFDLTWLQPKEFNALMESAGCHGVVIPAGTLRSTQTGQPIPLSQIRPAIDRICSDDRIGAAEAQPMLTRSEEENLDSLRSDHSEDFDSILDASTLSGLEAAVDESEDVPKNRSTEDLDIPDDLLNGIPSVASETEDESPEMPESSINGVNGAVQSNGAANELLKGCASELPSSTDPSTEAVNGSIPAINGSSLGSVSEPWWLQLPSIIVPKIKTEHDEGGNVEINISMDPDVTDFRAVLFEDEREAKGFLGILGHLYGPNTLVATKRQPPREFLEQHQNLDQSKIVVLCTGALLLERDADQDRVRSAVRLAHVATEIKKGVPYPPSHGNDAVFEKRAIKVAQTVVSNFKDRMDCNVHTHSQKGDANYLDPIEGFIHDLETGGLEDLFGTDEAEEGISAEVGGGEVKSILHPFGAQQDPTDETFYTQFVAQMNQNLNQAQEQIQKQGLPNGRDSVEADLVEASLDDLVREAERSESLEEDDEIEVVYPEAHRSDGMHQSGCNWFAGLAVVYLPQYLTADGRATYLAMSDEELGKRLVVGFQEQSEAVTCKEMMKQWADRNYSAAGVATVPPQVLLEFCDDHQVQAAVLRRGAIEMSLGMTQDEFLNRVALIANTQSAQYSVFNG